MGLFCSFRPNALSTIFGTVRFRRRLGTIGDSVSDPSRSIVENGLEDGFLGLCGLCTDSRGWGGCCVLGVDAAGPPAREG